jgi:PAS domain S-box-containing protein
MSDSMVESQLRLANSELNRRIAQLEERLLEKELSLESLQVSKEFQCDIRDISEHIRSDEKLRQISDRLLLATRAAKIGIWDFDVRNNSLVWDDTMFHMYGIAPDKFSGSYEAWRRNIHPDDLSRAEEETRMALRGEKEYDTEFRVLWPDQSVHYIKSTALVQRGASGQAVRMVGTNWDITELKEAQESLMKLTQAVAQSPVSIVITNVDGEIEFVNPKFTEVVGFRSDEVLGQKAHIFMEGEMRPDIYTQLWQTITSGNTWQGELQNKRKSGELFWEMVAVSPVKNSSGELTNFIIIKEDVSEQKALERQVRHAQKMDAIGTLAGGIAHDFNNLLTAIIGFGTLLEMEMAPDDPLRTNASSILSAADRAASLTKSLLTFSKEQSLDMKILDLNDVIRGVEKLLPQVLREDIECRLLLADEELTIFGDMGQIDQVLLNLAINARDAMPDGGELTISTMPMDMDRQFINAHGYGAIGHYAVLSVTDTGLGMDEATRQRIFEPFFTTKDVGKGTGLGLSIIFGIVKQHHGFITCYSEPGIGSTFNIYLPLHQGKIAREITQDAIPRAGGTETILLAEDEEAVRKLTRIILEEAGYRVIEAVNGGNAVQQYMDHRNEIALLVLDIIMPKKNGRDVYNEIREVNPHIGVIFTSGYAADVAHFQELSEYGFDFIAKPARPAELLNKVREVLDRR